MTCPAVLSDGYAWLTQNKPGIDVALGLLGVLGIFYAGRQLSENEKQRGITESFNLVEKLDERLLRWSTSARSEVADKVNLAHALGALLVSYEITTEAINRRYLSKMARELLTSQIIDSLPHIFGHPGTLDLYQYICPTEGICKAFKIFLINHYRMVNNLEGKAEIISAIYGPNNESLFSSGIVSLLEREVRKLRLRFSR